MDQQLSKSIAFRLVAALSAADVDAVIKEDEDARYWFDNPQNWLNYGGRSKNWDTVGNQQTNPVGALVELVTNGIDAILLRKAREAGIEDFRSAQAPQSMFEAVKRFFPTVVEGKITNLDPTGRTKLAEQSLLIGIKRADRANSRYPTYTVIDFGEGQKPEDFPSTFLSLSERNKEGIMFVQGKFNMGSTGSLRFCTRSDIRLGHYKLVVSRRPGHEYWGWTLIRIRGPRAGEALPVAEYFAPYGQVQRFKAPTLNAFGHESLGKVSEGTIVRLYEFDVGGRAYQVDFGLYDALTVGLIDCALPLQLYDFDAQPITGKGKLRQEGIAARTFGGLSVVLRSELPDGEEESATEGGKGTTEWVHHVLDEKHEELGHIKIIATGISKLKEFLQQQPARVFYTVNGQTHAIERASFLNVRVGLGDLRNHVLINVVCDGMDKSALSTIFMPDRERKANVELARILEDLVIRALKEDARLREYAAEIRRRRATEHVEDTEETKDFLAELAKIDPAIKDLFGLGTFLPEITQKGGGDKPYHGKKFPTFLEPLNLRQEGAKYVKEVPVSGYRRIECGTDANNDYLSRVDTPGETWSSLEPNQMPHSVSLRNGTATFTVRAPKHAELGQSVEAQFGFVDVGRNLEPLKFGVQIRYTDAEAPKPGKPGKKKEAKEDKGPSLGMPKFEWVKEADWAEHDFDEDAGAYVDTGEKTVVYLNQDNRYLRDMRTREKDEAARILNENMFRFGLGILALSIHRKAAHKDAEGAEVVVRLATGAMAPHIITIIRRLGGADARK
jgi:hypothetical protein